MRQACKVRVPQPTVLRERVETGSAVTRLRRRGDGVRLREEAWAHVVGWVNHPLHIKLKKKN